MHDDASPFFIAPHRFDAVDDDTGPVLDRRHELVPESGERILGRHSLDVAGYLLGPTEVWHRWALPAPVTLTVTDYRMAYVATGSQLALVGARHRRGTRMPGLVSGQIRWQWPSRLELLPATAGGPARLLVVCDALRTIQQPALALVGPAEQVDELARQVRRAVATFRLTRPELVDLSPPERDVLSRLALVAPHATQTRVILPGSLPVEFHSRDDYYRPRHAGQLAYDAASGQR
ncbi:hypothetical protein C1I95_23065 [Micromonospora craterilacus]|uniref:Uncharacterized protein n=1 Tax=Micromonospora craterilacus TaxID=1655439 RepID=A0A2W2EJJ8_9ACTN|nr:hypothetical protein [Micromonospora craterilacus]PZG13770.1 hypothetical protein C1I95_23065 [Micromonospora craterilacus]